MRETAKPPPRLSSHASISRQRILTSTKELSRASHKLCSELSSLRASLPSLPFPRCLLLRLPREGREGLPAPSQPSPGSSSPPAPAAPGDAAPVTSRDPEPSPPGRAIAEGEKCAWMKGACPDHGNRTENPFCTDPATWRRCSRGNQRGVKNQRLRCLIPALSALRGKCALFSSLPVRSHTWAA